MTELIIPLSSLAIAATFQPPQVIALIMLLQTRQGTSSGLAYLAGITSFRLVLGSLAWVLISSLEDSIETTGSNFSYIVGAILVVLGLLMLIHALRRGFSAQGEDEAAASWLDKMENVSPVQAFLVGIAFLALDPKDWIIDLSMINLIAEADLSSTQSLIAYLAYILLAQSLLWIPLVLALAAADKIRPRLAKLNTWMREHEKSIEIITAIIFGLLFLAIGLENLGVF